MNMMQLNQVVWDEKFVQKGLVKETTKAPVKFNDLIVALATKNPLWRFVVTDVNAFNTPTVRKVEVQHYGEYLGYIEWDYFRGDYGFEISNDRIKHARERTSAYKTHDEKKAFAAIKKTFSPKNVGERVADAVQRAEKLVNNQVWHKNRALHDIQSTLNKEALDFVKTMQEQFTSYLVAANKMHLMDKSAEARLELETLETMQKKFGACAIVIPVDGGYIVRVGDKTEMMDDTTLPHNMKAKLGMLKLVEDEHFITGIGGRVKADVFVLTPEEGESE